VLAKAHRQVLHLRESDPRAAGMAIAMDQDHARGIASILQRRMGVRATVATSDDPSASHRIAEFATGSEPWIVAVRMVSEGVDIPRLKVGVYATNTATDLFFRQAVGRLVRATGSPRQQRAYMFIPDDARLRAFAFGIATQRRHNLRKPDAKDEIERETEDERRDEEDQQPSLFAAISAIPLDEEGRPLDVSPVVESDSDPEPIPGMVDDDEELAAESFVLSAPDFERPVPTPEPEVAPERAPTPRSRKRKLREQNSACVRLLVHRTKQGHADINATLNSRVGIRRITEATAQQLERRRRAAENWLTRL
jgi:superfamily II DNA or RNA helicase